MRIYEEYDTVAKWCVNDAIIMAKRCVEKIIKPLPFILSANIINTMHCGPETRISVSIKTASLTDGKDDITVFLLYKPYESICNICITSKLIKNILNNKIFTSAIPSAKQILNLYKNYSQLCNLEIKKVLYKNPVTIVFWKDGSKTVVISVRRNDNYDPEKDLIMAIVEKLNGNTGCYYKEFKKWLPKEG
nr:MAG TPA: hypothetical protein [Caudoviricetes sp.]